MTRIGFNQSLLKLGRLSCFVVLISFVNPVQEPIQSSWLFADEPIASKDADASGSSNPKRLFDHSNLVAWCIVPFDAAKRGPAARAEMIHDLGLSRVAYDWRTEHVPEFEEEILQYKKHGIEFFAFWSWHDSLEPLIRKHKIKPQIWITLGSPQADTQEKRVAAAAEKLIPLLEKTRDLGLKLGLYNHGGWGGQPANLVAVCEYLNKNHNTDHVGIVYNFHHAHHDLDEFHQQFSVMLPHLLCLNLNGMADPATVDGNKNKIIPIGSGKHERQMMELAVERGYDGPIGILDHRNDMDARQSLLENLTGLDRVVSEMK